MEEMIFAPGSVPVAVVARVYGKDASWVRAGIISVSYTHLDVYKRQHLRRRSNRNRAGRLRLKSIRTASWVGMKPCWNP